MHTISATNARLIYYIVIFIVHNLFNFILSCSSRFSLYRASTFHFLSSLFFPFPSLFSPPLFLFLPHFFPQISQKHRQFPGDLVARSPTFSRHVYYKHVGNHSTTGTGPNSTRCVVIGMAYRSYLIESIRSRFLIANKNKY